MISTIVPMLLQKITRNQLGRIVTGFHKEVNEQNSFQQSLQPQGRSGYINLSIHKSLSQQ